MIRQILPISALLLGSAFLMFAGGINGLILPVRGGLEGFSPFALGLLGTGWAVGYVSGCIYMPRLVARVGHIRAFSIMSALAALSVLSSLVLLTPWAWIPLRAVAGFCFAGAAMIVESWLSEHADAASRGRVFGVYTMINLGAATAGQLTLTLGSATGFLFFVLAAMFYCLALIPTAAFSTVTPRPLVSVKLDVKALWRNSPVAVFAVFMVGASNSAFGTLAPVYAGQAGLVLTGIALFSAIPVLTGAITQVPVGYVSDRMDRRKVLLAAAVVAIAADLGFVLIRPEGLLPNLAIVALFGASVFAMYPVIVAHANDHAPENSFVQTSGGLLLVLGAGSIAGPILAGAGMSLIGNAALFLTTVGAHAAIFGFTLWRMFKRAPVTGDKKSGFIAMPSARSLTPETAHLGNG